MRKFTLVCDTPPLFCRPGEEAALLSKWQAWLEELRARDPDGEDEGVQIAVEEAETMIAKLKARAAT